MTSYVEYDILVREFKKYIYGGVSMSRQFPENRFLKTLRQKNRLNVLGRTKPGNPHWSGQYGSGRLTDESAAEIVATVIERATSRRDTQR